MNTQPAPLDVLGAEYSINFHSEAAIKAVLALRAAAVEFGFRVHYAKGRWWWTLNRPGWSRSVMPLNDFDAEADAWADIIVAHANALMEQ